MSVVMRGDYPKTLRALERRFGTEEACIAYLAGLRWPKGWKCPRCGGADAWSVRRSRWRCEKCRYVLSMLLRLPFASHGISFRFVSGNGPTRLGSGKKPRVSSGISALW